MIKQAKVSVPARVRQEPEPSGPRRMVVPRPRTQAQLEAARTREQQPDARRLMLKLQDRLKKVEAEKQSLAQQVAELQEALLGKRRLLARLVRERSELSEKLSQSQERVQQLLEAQDELLVIVDAMRLEGRQLLERQAGFEDEKKRAEELRVRLDAEIDAHRETRHRLRGARHHLQHTLMQLHQERREQAVAQDELRRQLAGPTLQKD